MGTGTGVWAWIGGGSRSWPAPALYGCGAGGYCQLAVVLLGVRPASLPHQGVAVDLLFVCPSDAPGFSRWRWCAVEGGPMLESGRLLGWWAWLQHCSFFEGQDFGGAHRIFVGVHLDLRLWVLGVTLTNDLQLNSAGGGICQRWSDVNAYNQFPSLLIHCQIVFPHSVLWFVSLSHEKKFCETSSVFVVSSRCIYHLFLHCFPANADLHWAPVPQLLRVSAFNYRITVTPARSILISSSVPQPLLLNPRPCAIRYSSIQKPFATCLSSTLCFSIHQNSNVLSPFISLNVLIKTCFVIITIDLNFVKLLCSA